MSKKQLYSFAFKGMLLTFLITLSGCDQTLRSNNLFVANDLLIDIRTNNSNSREFRIGEKLTFKFQVSHPLYIHCFYVSGKDIRKLAPAHTYRHHGIVKPILPKCPLTISGGYAAKPVGTDEVSCVGAEKPLLYKLPRKISDLNVFDKLDYRSINEVFNEFEKITDSQLYYKSISLNIIDGASQN